MPSRLCCAAIFVALLVTGCTSSTTVASDDPVVATTPSAVPAEPTQAVPLPTSAAAPTDEPTAEPTAPAASDDAASASLCPNSAALFGGSTGDGFNAFGDTGGSVDAAICKADDGTLQFVFFAHASGEQFSIPACQQAPDIWQATLENVTFTVIDERRSQRAIPGVLYADPGPGVDRGVQRQFETNIERAELHQNSFDAPLCPGSQRLCTTSVGTDETLNLRSTASLEASVLTGVPGGSCALWQYEPTEEAPPDGWAAVVFAPGATRMAGFVSTDFVRPAPTDQVLDVSGVVNVLFGTPWPEAIEALIAQLGEPDSLDGYDLCGEPGAAFREAVWENLRVFGHSPVGQPATDPPVLTFAAVEDGRFSAIGGLQGGDTWGEFVDVLPTSAPVKSLWSVQGRSHDVGEAAWGDEYYLTAGFPDIQMIDQVDDATVMASVAAGHTFEDC